MNTTQQDQVEKEAGSDQGDKTTSQSDSASASQRTVDPVGEEPQSVLEKADVTIQQKNAPEPPPNGGYGWVCCACVFLINAHTWGINSSYGVFLAHYLAEDVFPGSTSLDYAFVGSLSISTALLISPIATMTTREYGTRVTLLIGVFLETLSMITASFATEIWQLFLSQGICFGFGMGFLFIGSVGVVPQWFTTKRSLANGIATSGSGIGGLIYSLAAGAIIENISLAWAFRIIGILVFAVNTVCACLVRDRNKIIGSSQNAFDVSILKRTEYMLLGAWGWFSMLAYVTLIFSLANYADFIGLSPTQGSVVSALFNLGQGLGRPPIGYFSDSVGRINMATGMTILAGLFSLVIWTFANSYGVLIFFSLVGGFVAGTFWATIAPVVAEVVGLRHVPSGLNLTWLVLVLPCTFSQPIALEIVNGTGDYIGAQLFVGFMYIAGALCMMFLRGYKMAERTELARLKETAEAEGIENKYADDENLDAQKEGRKFKSMLTGWVKLKIV